MAPANPVDLRTARFQLGLSRMEAAIRSCSQVSGGLLKQNCFEESRHSSSPADDPLQSNDAADLESGLSEEDEALWRAKVGGYVEWLQKQLGSFHGMSDEALAKYQARVADLGPALERAFEMRRIALEPPAPAIAPAAEAPAEDAREAALQTVLAAVEGEVEAPPEIEPLPAYAMAREEPPAEPAAPAEPADPESAPPGSAGLRPRSTASAESAGKKSSGSSVPWRQAAAHRKGGENGPDLSNARMQMEEEMVDLVAGMKGHANSMLGILKKDNKELADMEELQQRGLDKVSAETQRGKKMMRSGQLGFLCTMAMLIISIVIFFMMIPFIIIT